MGDSHRNRYVKGDWLADCDVCGFTYLASQLTKRWDGFMVCNQDYEERHPSDLLRIPRPDRPVPWTRPPKHTFIERWYYADGSWTADGTIDGSGSGTNTDLGTPRYVTFGPVDPDSL